MVKELSFRLQKFFNPFVMLSVEGSSETRPFRHLCDDVFRSLSIFTKCVKFNIYFKNEKKIHKKFFVFEIIASELFVLNFLY